MAFVQIVEGRDRGITYNLVGGEHVIGRVRSRVRLSDYAVSRAHAKITYDSAARQWFLEDLGSTNGTYLNGKRVVRPVSLNNGDQIVVGTTKMLFGGAETSYRPQVTIDEDGNEVKVSITGRFRLSESSAMVDRPQAAVAEPSSLQIVQELISGIGYMLDVDLVLRGALNKIFSFISADRGLVFLLDDKTLVLKASRLANEDVEKIMISGEMVNQVISQQIGIRSFSAVADGRSQNRRDVSRKRVFSTICAPIKGRENVLGVIQLDCGRERHTYTDEQLSLLVVVGHCLGLAVENVRLYRSAMQLERLVAVGETAAYLSHHIKNILQALNSGMDVIEIYLQTEDLAKAKNAWPMVRRNLSRVNSLMLNILAFSKDRQPLLQRVDINQLLRECLELERPYSVERGIALLSELSELPQIEVDPDGLHRAFLNLITNAIDAVETNKGIVTVASEYDKSASNVIVTVTDNGKGISQEQQKHVFTPFFSSKGQKGTGLGLAVADMMIKEHHGRIEMTSDVGKGTAFKVILPAVSPQESDVTHTEIRQK